MSTIFFHIYINFFLGTFLGENKIIIKIKIFKLYIMIAGIQQTTY